MIGVTGNTGATGATGITGSGKTQDDIIKENLRAFGLYTHHKIQYNNQNFNIIGIEGRSVILRRRIANALSKDQYSKQNVLSTCKPHQDDYILKIDIDMLRANIDHYIDTELSKVGLKPGEEVELSVSGNVIDYNNYNNNSQKTAKGKVVGYSSYGAGSNINIIVEFEEHTTQPTWKATSAGEYFNLHSTCIDTENKRYLYCAPAALFKSQPANDKEIEAKIKALGWLVGDVVRINVDAYKNATSGLKLNEIANMFGTVVGLTDNNELIIEHVGELNAASFIKTQSIHSRHKKTKTKLTAVPRALCALATKDDQANFYLKKAGLRIGQKVKYIDNAYGDIFEGAIADYDHHSNTCIINGKTLRLYDLYHITNTEINQSKTLRDNGLLVGDTVYVKVDRFGQVYFNGTRNITTGADKFIPVIIAGYSGSNPIIYIDDPEIKNGWVIAKGTLSGTSCIASNYINTPGKFIWIEPTHIYKAPEQKKATQINMNFTMDDRVSFQHTKDVVGKNGAHKVKGRVIAHSAGYYLFYSDEPLPIELQNSYTFDQYKASGWNINTEHGYKASPEHYFVIHNTELEKCQFRDPNGTVYDMHDHVSITTKWNQQTVTIEGTVIGYDKYNYPILLAPTAPEMVLSNRAASDHIAIEYADKVTGRKLYIIQPDAIITKQTAPQTIAGGDISETKKPAVKISGVDIDWGVNKEKLAASMHGRHGKPSEIPFLVELNEEKTDEKRKKVPEWAEEASSIEWGKEADLNQKDNTAEDVEKAEDVSFSDSFQHHLVEAGYRIAATQITNSTRGILSHMLSKHMASKNIKNLNSFLQTDFGAAFLAIFLGMTIPNIPHLNENVKANKLAEELRIHSLTLCGNSLMDMFVEELMKALKDMPEEVSLISSNNETIEETATEEAEEAIPELLEEAIA